MTKQELAEQLNDLQPGTVVRLVMSGRIMTIAYRTGIDHNGVARYAGRSSRDSWLNVDAFRRSDFTAEYYPLIEIVK